MRKYLLVATVLLVACFVYLTALTPVTHAASAQFGASGMSYEGNTYIGPSSADGSESPDIKKGTTYYSYTEAAGTGTGGATPKAHLIYFAPGVDPGTATSASYRTFDIAPNNSFINPSAAQIITIEQIDGNEDSSETSAPSEDTTACAVEGIGWIVCPITNFLAKGMDTIYGMVSDFLVVRPLQTTGDNAMFRAWSYMRGVANIAFVIAFMIIIYSQLTGIGLSNYSVKKMLPRVIVAAILVNTSYWICAVAIDAGNILGYSLQDMFMSIRNSLVGKEGNSWDVISWSSMASFILSGGSLAAGAGIATYLGLAAIGGVTVGGLIFLFLPLLLSVLFVVLMTFLILAARQAIITILVVLAPLAFVAYLLPNTEKWFEKWRSTFFTLLIVFPGFSLIFGGSQLAAAIIIQNANSLTVILLAMAVQVMPLAITPLLLKLGGGVLNRFAGIVNNPTKGVFDRGKAWSKERLEANQAAKMKRMAENPGSLRRFGASRVAYARNQNKRRREAWKSANEAMSDSHWKNTSSYQRIQQRNLEAGQLGETGESQAQLRYNNAKLVANSRIQQRDIAARMAKLDVEVAEGQANVQWENLRAAPSAHNIIPAHLATQALHAQAQTRESSVAAQQLKSAQHEQQQDFARALRASEALQTRAGGIAEHGADAALAAAIATERQAYGKSVEEARQIVKHFNLSSEERQKHALGQTVVKTDSNGNTRSFQSNNIFTREAVIEDQIATGTVEQAQEIVSLSGSQLAEFRTTISDSVAKSALGGKTVFLGGATINEIAKGTITSKEKLHGIILDNVVKMKFSADKLVGMDKDALAAMLTAIEQRDSLAGYMEQDPAKLEDAIKVLSGSATRAIGHDDLKQRITDNAKPFMDIISGLAPNPQEPFESGDADLN